MMQVVYSPFSPEINTVVFYNEMEMVLVAHFKYGALMFWGHEDGNPFDYYIVTSEKFLKKIKSKVCFQFTDESREMFVFDNYEEASDMVLDLEVLNQKRAIPVALSKIN